MAGLSRSSAGWAVIINALEPSGPRPARGRSAEDYAAAELWSTGVFWWEVGSDSSVYGLLNPWLRLPYPNAVHRHPFGDLEKDWCQAPRPASSPPAGHE